MRLLGPHESPKVADYHQNMKSVALEEGLFLWDVQGRHYQYALGGIQELASRGPSHHKIIQVLLDPLEGAARPRVIRVLGLGDSNVGLPQFTDEQEDSQPIHHHRQWVSLGHSLLAEKEVTRPVTRPDHQCGPVAVAVECEPCATWPLKTHRTYQGCAVLLIERIVRVNKEEPPILLLGVLLPQELYSHYYVLQKPNS